MSHFDPYRTLLECTPTPLGEEFKVTSASGEMYQRAFPPMCCSWDRGFYLQVQLLEFDFGRYAPDHSAKTSLVFMGWRPTLLKTVRKLDGTTGDLPVLVASICLNRGLFQPLTNQNLIEWSESITSRTRGIAHELLYVDQYAKNFDTSTGETSRPVAIPTVEEDELLLCPSQEIESFLHTIEQRFGVEFGSSTDFMREQPNTAVQGYYSAWLTQRGVERDICHRRTCQYLDSGMRRHHGTIKAVLTACMQHHGIDSLDVAAFKRHVNGNTDFYRRFISELQANGCNAQASELTAHATLILKRNGHKAK